MSGSQLLNPFRFRKHRKVLARRVIDYKGSGSCFAVHYLSRTGRPLATAQCRGQGEELLFGYVFGRCWEPRHFMMR